MTTTQPATVDLPTTMVGPGLLAGAANVIMQLAHPAVGYGVLESRVESGQLFRHPMKRTRTTLTYLAVAVLGTDAERMAYRRAVNTAHVQVRSTETSPVRYNALNPELQLWVAACLYRGSEDVYRAFVGTLDEPTAAQIYQAAAVLGTTLQVREDMWPADRAAFEEYWAAGVDKIAIDEPVREHLQDIVDLKFLPRVISLPLGGFNRFVTTGFLPPRFREQMRLPWSPRQQRRFDRLMSAIGTVSRAMPVPLREFPYNLCLWDLRYRIRTGRPLV